METINWHKRKENRLKMITKTILKFSVIIPVYNVENYIIKCMDSVLSQTESNFEVIIIDDGSTDYSGLICERYHCDKRVKVIHTENNGPMAARLKGVELSRTEYVVFIDGDDWIAPRMFEHMWNAIEKYRADLVNGNFVCAGLRKELRKKCMLDAGCYDGNDIKEKIYPIMLNAGDFQKRGIPVSLCAKMIRKNIILDNIKYYIREITYSEDLNIIFPVLLDCQKIVVIDTEDSDYYYRYNPNSILHTFNNNMYGQIVKLYPMLILACKEKNNVLFDGQIKADYIAAMVQVYKNELMNPAGYQSIMHHINKYTKDVYFKLACREVEWKHYRKINVVIIWSMQHWNFITKYIITGMFYFLMKCKIMLIRGKYYI